MPDLLLELFSEEIPARMQGKAAKDLERMMNERLLAAGFLPEGVKAFAGPRRLALIATGLPLRQPDRREEKKGPRVGAPAQAIDGFLKSAGLSALDQCEIVEDKKGAYYVAKIEQKGRETADVLSEAVPAIVREFPWPKSMRWGDGDLRWVRPLKSVLCCFNDEVVPFEIDGVKSGDATRGHRRISSAPIHARNFDKYVVGLTNAKVILDGAAREGMIAADARTLCEAQGLELVEDRGLLAEVAGLAEWPVVMMGSFDRKFLTLPDEVLTASMRGHQKYFSVKDPKTGRLAAKFVFVANIEAPDGGAAMRAGYERVLTARLSDAWYLYHQDLKTPLEERTRELDRITFFEGLGSVGRRVERLEALSNDLARYLKTDIAAARRAARLAKSDLVTGMVKEFPELQGVMGRYYALAQQESAEIADAIRDHYRPASLDDAAPTALASIVAALADKLDSLNGFFAIDELPTGSKDPFALRRAALGVIRIVLDNKLRIPFEKLKEGALQLYRNQLGSSFGPGSVNAILPFLHDRLKVYLRDKGHKYDAIDAALMKADGSLEDDLVLIVMKLEALEAFLKTDDGANLAAGYKRAANILKAEAKKGKLPEAGAVDARLLQQAEEKALFAALKSAEEKAAKAVAEEKFEDAMTALASLRGPIDAFFDKVTVNAEDEILRANRLALLQRFTAATARVAELSKLEG
ncbi:MAG: glycine--tRNA ligase subunit beta [Parvularculaceae bacterium]|nr:glycine--tRNA ligase subunit beta [Parvularculaceae bacterium]